MSWFSPSWQQRPTRSLYCPSFCGGGEENQKKKIKLVGLDKDRLIEQRRKKTLTTTILIRIIYKTKWTQRATLSYHYMPGTQPSSGYPSPSIPTPGQLRHSELNVMSHSIEHPICLASLGQPFPGCVSCWFLVKINPVSAKPRTRSFS